jgi:tripartite-type tricarboxylate transporter receptor subunit TctC
VQLSFMTVLEASSHIKAGKLRALAVTGDKRVPAFPGVPTLPDVPTEDEQGLKGYDANTNGGFLAPAGTPKAMVDKLNTEINAALKLPDVRTKLEAAGIEIQGGTPQEYAAVIKADLAKWGKVVKEAGIQPE